MKLALLSTALLAVAACSSTSSTDASMNDGGDIANATDTSMGVDSGDPTASCTALATARCAKLDSCSNGVGVAHTYGSMDVCVTRLTANCVASLMVAGTAATPTFEIACGAAITAETCADFRNGITPAACVAAAGPLANGMPCVTSGQCQSQVCLTPRNSLCGTCAPQPSAGDDCAMNSGCGRDLVCNHNATAGTYTCRALVAMGGTCDIDHPCGADLGCVRTAATATMGTCQSLGMTVGAACNDLNIAMPTCDANQGLFCNGMSQCAMATVAMAGQACGPMSMRATDSVCTAGGFCPAAATGTTTRMCLAAASDGQPCDSTLGPPCLAPSRCIVTATGADAGTAGTCMVLNPTACH